MPIQQSFYPTARLSIAAVASEILRQWPLYVREGNPVCLVTGHDVSRDWEVLPIDDEYPEHGKVSVGEYPKQEPSRTAAKRLASALIKGLRPVNR